jgi:AcrR family transcriptional regulator
MKGSQSPRDRLFQTAARLFYAHGYRAVGVDMIAAESGIGKMTLYRHYPSKDDLISAYLEESDALFWRQFDALTTAAHGPRAKLHAFFAGLQDYVTTPACHGCPFLNVVTEYPEPDYPGHRIALRHKQAVRARLRALASDAGAHAPHLLADSLFLLMDGAYMAARTFGATELNPAAGLADAARLLLDAHGALDADSGIATEDVAAAPIPIKIQGE